MRGISITSVRTGPYAGETFLAKLLAYIPAEVIAAYQAISGLLAGPASTDAALATFWWVVLFVILAVTPFWVMLTTWSAVHSPAWTFRIWASPLAFGVWTFVLGGPWLLWLKDHHEALFRQHGAYASTFLILVTLILPLIELGIEIVARKPARAGR